jgi:endonuclease/exonuclease/phosphatase (EEP) superfamily protein YafD
LTELDTIGYDSLTKREVVQLKAGIPVYSAEIEEHPEKWIALFAVHLRSSAYSTARRSMDEDASWMDGLPLYYENYKKGQKIRNWEADNLRLHLEALESEDMPVIIAGDFNDWSGSYCMNTIRDRKYKDAWWEGGFGFGITYDEWHLKLRLDHILYSHHFKLENVYVEKSKFSDHRPLIADFILIDPY